MTSIPMMHEVIEYGWHSELGYVLALSLALGFLVAQAYPEQRRAVGNTLILLGLSLVALVAAGIAHHVLGIARAAEVLYELAILVEGITFIRLSGLFLFEVLLRRLEVAGILQDILIGLGYIAWGLVRLRYAGMDLSGLVTTSAVVTAVLAFSLQDTLGNLLSGLALELDNSFDIGDWLSVDGTVGRVVAIRWRSTSLETRNGETVVIPNAVLMKSRFSVIGRRIGQPLQWRRWIWFNVEYNVSPGRVVQIVEAVLTQSECPGVAKDPPPSCLLMEFDRSSARYGLRYWLTRIEADDATDSIVRTHVFSALQRAGIRIAIPDQNIHLIKEGEKHDEVRRAREHDRRMNVLRRIDLFAALNDDELFRLADRLTYAPFARGETITHQGNVAHWLYILADGEVDAYRESPEGRSRWVQTMSACSAFGEMGLMTGAARSATVIAKTDVECYRLDKTVFESVLQSRPELADAISKVLATRPFAVDSLAKADPSDTPTSQPQRASEILGRIRRFFGLQ
jgi:small-conductance mechanosensitive channel